MKKVEKQNIPILSPRYGISCSHHPRLLSCTSFYRRLISLFFALHLVRIFRRTPMDALRRGRRPRRPASAHHRIPAHFRLILRRGRRPRRPASAHLRIPVHSRLSLRRGRRPRRPVARSFYASGGNISRSGATSFCPRRQKDAKTPPKTNGFWISLARFQPRYKKVPHRIACTPLIAAAPAYHAETRRSVIVQWDCCAHIGGFPNTGAPRWTHPVGAGVPDGPLMFPPCPQQGEYSAPRARVTFGRSPKSDQKCCLKPQVSRLPARLTAS